MKAKRGNGAHPPATSPQSEPEASMSLKKLVQNFPGHMEQSVHYRESLEERILLTVIQCMTPRLGSFPAGDVVNGKEIAKVARDIIAGWREGRT